MAGPLWTDAEVLSSGFDFHWPGAGPSDRPAQHELGPVILWTGLAGTDGVTGLGWSVLLRAGIDPGRWRSARLQAITLDDPAPYNRVVAAINQDPWLPGLREPRACLDGGWEGASRVRASMLFCAPVVFSSLTAHDPLTIASYSCAFSMCLRSASGS
jgi:hypothetical protein